jgi:caffeoyl-CoA O-methyltransferase
MEFILPAIEQYAHQYTSDLDTLLQEVLDYTEEYHPQKHMVSGKVQGQFLQLFSSLLQPKYILEVGTFTGYSALCLAKGLQPNGELHTIELRANDATTASRFFEKSTHTHQLKLHIGDALNVIPMLKYTWDLVFIDADKVNYSNYYDLILPNVKQGGIIIADNVLFHGEVLDATTKNKSAKAIQHFNNKIKSDPTIEHVLLTVRDGLQLIRKIK